MIKKLLCKVWGHKFIVKAYTGQTYMASNGLGDQHLVSLYDWKKMDYCLRCGKDLK